MLDIQKMGDVATSNRVEQQLLGYLAKLRVKHGEPFTHTTLSPAASYYIGTDEYEKFITLYCNAVSKGVRPTVTERPGGYFPLRFDFDLKSNLDNGLKRKYSKEILAQIIGFIQQEIRNALSDEVENIYRTQICVVLEKKAPRVDEGVIKDGFHFHFPFFPCEEWFQDQYLRTKINEKMITEKTWEGIRFQTPVEKFIDTGMAKKPWLMYGSAKARGAEPFLVSTVYGPTSNPEESNEPEEITLEDVFGDEMEGRKSKLAYYLPRFMTIRGCEENTPLNMTTLKKRESFRPRKPRMGVIVKRRSMEDVMEDIKLIKEGGIMDMLSDERADGYDEWMDVGWTMFNVGQGCDEALELWIEFSRRSSSFTDGKCEELWARMEVRDKTIGSLLAMARSDSPDDYKTWKDMNVNTTLAKSLVEDKPNEWDVAQVVLKLYKDKFVCADAKKDIWFEFFNHKWQYMDDNITLRKLLATEVVNLYYEYKSSLSKQQIGADETERQKLEVKEQKCRKIVTALKECKFQERLIKMCKVIFYDGQFLKKLDENRLLFVCDNGVLDLELLCFRDGRPDDYSSLSCNVVYPKNATHDDDGIMEVDELLRKVFPNPKLKQYYLDTASSAMEGGNVNKIFVVGTGGGDGGKTVMSSFLELVFGDYNIKFPRELFVMGKTNSSGSARPELARVRGKRLAQVSELAKTETINIGVLKELTGNDSFFARGIYEKGTDIKPMFTLFMACNEPPKVPGHDDATWNRIRVLDYESKFVKSQDLKKFPVPESEEEQFKMKRFKADGGLMRRLPELAPSKLWLLFENYKEYKKRGIIEPDEVRASTNIYREHNDVYLEFVKEHIKIPTEAEIAADTTEEKYFVRVQELYEAFVTWYHESYTAYAKEKFNKQMIMLEFSKKFGIKTIKRGRITGWYGLELQIEDESAFVSVAKPGTRIMPGANAPKAKAKVGVAAPKAKAPKAKAGTVAGAPKAKAKVPKAKAGIVAGAPKAKVGAAKAKPKTKIVSLSVDAEDDLGAREDVPIVIVKPAPKMKFITNNIQFPEPKKSNLGPRPIGKGIMARQTIEIES